MRDPVSGTTPVIRVFGGIDIEDSGNVTSVGGRRQRRLLALLAIRAGQVVSNDWLSEYLWDDTDRPEDAVPSLRTYVSRLRQAMPEEAREWIVTEQSGYRLVAPPDGLEHTRFAAMRTRARQARESGDPATAKQLLDSALEMWRGDPFRELEDIDWAQAEVERLRTDRLETMEERWETALALGRHTQITGDLAAFTAEQPLRERAVRQYALALYRSGRTTEALRVIDDHRKVVGEASGLEPSPALMALENAILSGDPALELADGTPLRGYRLLDQVGAGAFSVVWRGIQPSVNRTVAVKQIRAELASQPDFIRQFEAEANLVARIEHPHIVPLIDFWRDPDAAYLVMRWLPGGTLERLLDDGPLTLDRTLEIVEQIGAALSTAHAHQVIHRDVKSANVLFDDSGNAFLTDFGIALEAARSSGPAAALSTGSPAYASPEQLRRDPLGPAADIFSLAVVTYECLAGRTPFWDSQSAEVLLERQLHEAPPSILDARADLPPHVADALARALSKEAADRFRTVADFSRALRQPTESTADVAPPTTVGENPYLGLRAFGEADAARFFGRGRLVAELVQRLASPHVLESGALVVVGPSGSGKSSVVRAGLLPALRAGAVDGSERWFTTTMVPGTDPFESLEAALLRIAVNPPASLVEQLRDGPRGILRTVRRCLPGDDDVLVLVVDQFEETFIGQSADDADAFLDALAVAVDDPTSPLRLICTLRADYYDRPLRHMTFAPVLKRGAVDVTPLAPDEMEDAIVEPARLAGLTFEPGLVARISAETLGQPSPLPLLQHVLAELYERRSGGLLTSEAYEQLGGVSGALAERAESVYLAAGDDERAAARRLFGALTDPGEERADLRRRVPIDQLGADTSMADAVGRFAQARLLTFDRDVNTREPTVEVAHEALLREWPRLVGWLEEDRDLLRSVGLLTAASTSWDASGRQPSDLLRGGRLSSALDLALLASDRLRPLDIEFVEASKAYADAALRAEHRRVRRLRRLNVGVSLALVVALVAGGLAVTQRNRAEQATAEAENERNAAELAALIRTSDALVDENFELSTLLALEAHRRSPGASTERAVLNALASAPAQVTSFDLPEPGNDPCAAFDNRLTLSADGRTGFSTADERLITIDLSTGDITDHGPAPATCVQWTGDADADLRWVIQAAPASDSSGGGSASVAITSWSGPWGQPLRPVEIEGAGKFVGSMVGDRILLGSTGGETLVVDARSTEVIARVETLVGALLIGPDWASTRAHGGDAWAISDDGSYIAVPRFSDRADADGVIVIDGRTGGLLHEIDLDQPPTAITIRDGAVLIGGLFGRLTTVDLATGAILSEVATSSTTGVFAVGFRADHMAVVVSGDRVELVDPIHGPIGAPALIDVGQAAVRPDGMVTVVDPGQTRVSTLEMQSTALVESSIDVGPDTSVGFGLGRAAVVNADGQVEIIDLRTNFRESFDLTQSGAPFEPIAAFPTESGFVAFNDEAAVGRWSDGHLEEVVSLDRSGDGATLIPWWAVGIEFHPGPLHTEGLVVVYPASNDYPDIYSIDWAGGTLDAEFVDSKHFWFVSALATADGDVHVLNDSGLVRTYDRDGRWSGEVDTDLPSPLAVARSDMGLIAAGGHGGAIVAQPATGDMARVAGVADVAGLGFSRDGEVLVVLETDGSVHLWDVVAEESIGEVWAGTGPVRASKPWFDPDRGTVWVATAGRLLELSLEPERWIENACAFVGRNLTQEEWRQYVPGDEPPRSACP